MSHLFVLELNHVADPGEVERHLATHREFFAQSYSRGPFLASGRKHPRTDGTDARQRPKHVPGEPESASCLKTRPGLAS